MPTKSLIQQTSATVWQALILSTRYNKLLERMKAGKSVDEVINTHTTAGRFFNVGTVRSFALDQGNGPVVLCLHGVPTSSFLYRKMIPALSAKGFRAVALDFPGMGLSDRPHNCDYSFVGLSKFGVKAIEALGITDFHLVVHDIGGPIGFAIAAALPHRVKSITVLNSWINVDTFRKPFSMRPFETPVLGKLYLAMLNYKNWETAFASMGVEYPKMIPMEETHAYVDLLKGDDNGRAFLKIMRSFDASPTFREVCYRAVQRVPYPVQLIWGEKDPALTWKRYGTELERVANPFDIYKIPAKHLLQEDHWEFICTKISEIREFEFLYKKA